MKELTKVKFTNLEKILFPELQIKKAQVIEYYIKIAPRILEFIDGRAIVINRFPNGVDKPGFYEKDLPKGTPSWVKRFKKYSENSQREINYVMCDDLDTLLWLANLAAIEIHMPFSKTSSYENPDLVLFDIDPEPPANFQDSIEVSFLLKEILDGLGLKSYVKTSGKKGIHIVLPIENKYNFKQTREFVHLIGKHLARESELVVSEFSQSRDPETVYIDYRQNSSGRTMISPYSLRAEKLALVSTPIEWMELKKKLRPEEFNINSVLKREKVPWKGLWEQKQNLELD
ncbi:MAG: non-homologous end-joining DNA ligase [Candidatus Sifarchaeia archaeon]|jgi:bifunctional non-homologous end joining protein LigD